MAGEVDFRAMVDVRRVMAAAALLVTAADALPARAAADRLQAVADTQRRAVMAAVVDLPTVVAGRMVAAAAAAIAKRYSGALPMW